MRTLLGTGAHSIHVQNVARSLYEAGWLRRYETGAVDVWRSPLLRELRARAGSAFPRVDRELKRRQISQVPHDLVYPHKRWDIPRVVLERFVGAARTGDWLWERGEHALADRFARLMETDSFDLYVGVEHGALEALRACRNTGKTGVCMFLSPHHAFLSKWLAPEFEEHPELLSPARQQIEAKNRERYERVDEEMQTAHVVRANSSLTARSLIEAGLDPDRIVTVPLGGPPPLDEPTVPADGPTRVIYAGPLSVRKGFHYLLDAWRRLQPSGAELHAYGVPSLPSHLLRSLPPGLVLHGSVPRSELMAAYQHAHLLVIPTLCDGFGMVISEALSRGVPVLTTSNAGAADLIEEGKNGYVVPPADADALAAQLDACLRSPDALVAMRPYALDTARSWTWEHFRRAFTDRLAEHVGVPVRND